MCVLTVKSVAIYINLHTEPILLGRHQYKVLIKIKLNDKIFLKQFGHSLINKCPQFKWKLSCLLETIANSDRRHGLGFDCNEEAVTDFSLKLVDFNQDSNKCQFLAMLRGMCEASFITDGLGKTRGGGFSLVLTSDKPHHNFAQTFYF